MRRLAVAGLLCVVVFSVGAQPWQGFTTLSLGSDGRSFATGGREGEVLWWEVSTGELLGRWALVPGLPVVELTFGPRDGDLTVRTLDGKSWIFSLGPGVFGPPVPGPASTPGENPRPPMVPAATSAGELTAEGTSDGRITVRSRTEGRVLVSWQADDSGITGLALAPDGSFLLSCSYGGGLAKWDPRTGTLLGRL